MFEFRRSILLLLIAFALSCLLTSWCEAMSVHLVDQQKGSSSSEQKLDSQLLFAIRQMRGEPNAPSEEIKLKKDKQDRILVDVRAPVTKRLLARIKSLGGKVVSSSNRDDSVIAYISLAKLQTLAQSKDVRFIMPAAEAITN